MARQLSHRETDVLKVIEARSGRDTRVGVTGPEIARALATTSSVSTAGAHQTAASLCRKNLAWRLDTSPQMYRITHTGREALKGSQSGKWIARGKPA